MEQCMPALRINSLDQSILRSTKKLLQKLHCNLIFCLENLGLWGALQVKIMIFNHPLPFKCSHMVLGFD